MPLGLMYGLSSVGLGRSENLGHGDSVPFLDTGMGTRQ